MDQITDSSMAEGSDGNGTTSDPDVKGDNTAEGTDEMDLTSDSEVKSHRKKEPFPREDFNPDEWELVEEDNCLIELHGVARKNYLKKCDKDRVKLIGLFDENGKMFLQLDELIFMGEPTETFGTNALFEEYYSDGESSEDEDTFRTVTPTPGKQKVKLRYLTHTEKKISMYRALLVDKTVDEKSESQ
uniref:uncharacterized protein LOC120331565 n=1 Tax=Styela clava TaxID=7725 RepID=UPI001939D4C6|nr:uncharacterized protein LOC120331565 [Styela clava]